MVRVAQLKGHDRPITHIKFNREGDLLFSASKSKTKGLAVWDVESGELKGHYFGHDGAVSSLDIDFNTTKLLSGSRDQTIKLWDASNGDCLRTYQTDNPILWVNYALGDQKFLSVTAGVMGKTSSIFLYDLNLSGDEPMGMITSSSSNIRFTQAFWGPLNETIYAGLDSGEIVVYDVETGKEKDRKQAHINRISRMQTSLDLSHFITSSTDSLVRVYETRTLNELKSFDTGRPVNDAALFPNVPHIVASGGQSAESVTTSKLDVSQFKLRIFHKIFMEEIASVGGHFGPVQSLAVSPTGRNFASGAEDGYIRLHYLDDEYYKNVSDKTLFTNK